MKPIAKSVLAGIAGAGGAVAVDQYVVQAPPSPNVYYGAAGLALVGAYLLRKKPYVVGALGGIALGAAYRGYMRGAARAAMPRPVQAPPPAPTSQYAYPFPPYQSPYPAGATSLPPPQPGIAPQQIQQYAEAGMGYGKQIAEMFGGATPASVAYSDPGGISDEEFYGG